MKSKAPNKSDGRKNNKGVIKPDGEKMAYLKVRAKKKNHPAILEKIIPIVKKLDK